MRLDMTSPSAVEAAAGLYPASYHRDYAVVRRSALPYLAGDLGDRVVSELAGNLDFALRSWGAGKRAAPDIVDSDSLANSLRSVEFHGYLRELTSLGLSAFGLGGNRREVNGRTDREQLLNLRRCLWGALVHISRTMLVRPSGVPVTYPTKTLLMLTGLLPALDQNARAGMWSAEITGMSGRYRTIRMEWEGDLARLWGLLFLFGDCWQRHGQALSGAFRTAGLGEVVDDLAAPGRVFDILFFAMGANKGLPPCLKADGCGKLWHERLTP